MVEPDADAAVRPAKTWCVVYLASPKDRRVSPTGPRRLDVLRASLRITRACFPARDIYVFHEDFSDVERELCPEVSQFVEVDFSGGDAHYLQNARPKGYLMMSRFFSGGLQKNPLLDRYTHYMRLDDDSFFLEPRPTDSCIDDLLDNDYIFRSVFREGYDQHSLYEFTVQYLRSLGFGECVAELEARLRSFHFLDKNGRYTGLAPYNNFHVASLRLWRHPLVEKYLDSLEEGHHILRQGWLDANIHAMIVFVLRGFAGAKIRLERGFGYRHNRHVAITGSPWWILDETLPFHPQFSDLPACE